MTVILYVLGAWFGLVLAIVLWAAVRYVCEGRAMARQARRLARVPRRTYGCGVAGTVVPLDRVVGDARSRFADRRTEC